MFSSKHIFYKLPVGGGRIPFIAEHNKRSEPKCLLTNENSLSLLSKKAVF